MQTEKWKAVDALFIYRDSSRFGKTVDAILDHQKSRSLHSMQWSMDKYGAGMAGSFSSHCCSQNPMSHQPRTQPLISVRHASIEKVAGIDFRMTEYLQKKVISCLYIFVLHLKT